MGGTGIGVFDTKDVGTAKSVTVSGYTLGGIDAGNYTLSQPSGLSANITDAPIISTKITLPLILSEVTMNSDLPAQSSKIREFSSCSSTVDVCWDASLNYASVYNIGVTGPVLHIVDCDMKLFNENDVKVFNDKK